MLDDITKRIAASGKPADRRNNLGQRYWMPTTNEVTALQSSMQAQREQVDKLMARSNAKESQALKISRTTDARLALERGTDGN